MGFNVGNILQNIVDELDQYIKSVVSEPEPTTREVILGNIATSELGGGNNSLLNNKVVMGLVNLAEEGSLKNKTNNFRVGSEYYEQHAPVYINLYLLFTANFSADAYDKAINRLFRVIEFFQGRKVFNLKKAIRSSESNTLLDNANADVFLEMDLHTLSFEQLNDLWGSLGGKQLPFVLYRARLLPIQMERTTGRAGAITEIDLVTQKTEMLP